MAASSKKLGRLHALFADYFEHLFTRVDEDGNPYIISAAELAVMRAFLKDNNVMADPDVGNNISDVANEARKAMSAAGISTVEMDAIADDFANFAMINGSMQ